MPARAKLPDGHTRIKLDLRLDGQDLQVDIAVPSGPATMSDLLPALRAITDAVVEAASRRSSDQGRPVSCKKGCDACCRQLVPITHAEAAALPAIVAGLSKRRQARVAARLAEIIRRCAEAGILERIEHPERDTPREADLLAYEYFQLRLPCPFLENGACMIRPFRPLECRQYIVCSPAAYCAVPLEHKVERVPLSAQVAEVSDVVDAEISGRRALAIALPVALMSPPGPGAAAPSGVELLSEVLRRLLTSGKGQAE